MADQVEINHVELRSFYVRERHCMAVYADFGAIYEDYYLHLMQIGERLDPEHDTMLKDALAALTLHLTARPRAEMSAWTIHYHDPLLNLFVTGDSEDGNVVGRVFTEDVKATEKSLFIAQITDPRTPSRKSTVDIEGRDVLRNVEQYYAQSEQLPARLYRMGGDAYAMVVAQPDVDMPWFDSIDTDAVRNLETDEELRLLERRRYHFACGCNLRTILNVLVTSFKSDPQGIFAGEEQLQIHCPRCAGVFTVDPPQLEAYLKDRDADSEAR